MRRISNEEGGDTADFLQDLWLMNVLGKLSVSSENFKKADNFPHKNVYSARHISFQIFQV